MTNDENDEKRHKRDIFVGGHFCWRHRGNRTWPGWTLPKRHFRRHPDGEVIVLEGEGDESLS